MKLSNIKSVFLGNMSLDAFKSSMQDEMKEYILLKSKRRSSMPVYLIEDGALTIGEKELRVLCEAYLNKDLNEMELNYIADALLLSNKVEFEEDEIADRIGYLTDPEINGHLTDEIVLEIMSAGG